MLSALFLLGCGDSEEKPSTKDYEKQFSVEVPAYLELSSFDVEASENVGSKVEPYYKARFKATVKLNTKTFELSSKENEATFIRPVAGEGETKEIYGVASARLSAGNWKIDFKFENNPIPALGRPKDFFTGGRVLVVGTAEESDFKAQIEQKQLVAQQEAEKALKTQQAEQERLAAEQQRKRVADEQERQQRQIALEAERKVAEKAAEERLTAQRLERERREAERAKNRLAMVEVNGFMFELTACYRVSSRSVICEVLTTNNGRDQELSVYARKRKDMAARLYDDLGNEYLATSVTFGNSVSQNEVRKKLVSDVGVKAIFEFDNIPASLSMIAALDLGIWTQQPWRTKFRNIAIGK